MSVRKVAGLVVVALLATISPALANHDDGDDYGDGGRNGNGNDQRHCHESENCRGSFSPGPFDRSPVDIHDNQVCISPDCSHSDKGDKDPQRGPGPRERSAAK